MTDAAGICILALVKFLSGQSRATSTLAFLALAAFTVNCSDDDDGVKRNDAGQITDGIDGGILDANIQDAGAPDGLRADAGNDAVTSSDAATDAAPPTTTVFAASLDETLPPQVAPGDCVLTPSQGYAPVGPEGNKFGPTFLRCSTSNTFTLTLTNLPPHTSMNIEFLFAAIDSLDGTGTFPAGDFFGVYVDNVVIFKESFANAVATQIQTYNPPPGVELARRVDLGFSGPGSFYTDSAYNMGADPVFQNIAHTGSTAILKFTLEGGGIQSLDDESWAIDNLRVSTGNTPRAAGPDAGSPDAN